MITIEHPKGKVQIHTQEGIGIHLIGFEKECLIEDCLLRVCTALNSMDVQIPCKKIIIKVESDEYKNPYTYDLPIAIGLYLLSKGFSGTIPFLSFQGELSMDGKAYNFKHESPVSIHKFGEGEGASFKDIIRFFVKPYISNQNERND